MNDTLLDMWASSPRQTAHLTSAQPDAPVITSRRGGVRQAATQVMGRAGRHRTATALLLAVLVLSVGLGGTAAAVSLVTGKQIKDGSVRGRDIGNGSLTGSDVADKSLTPADFSGSVQGPAGPQGPAGAQGPRGPPGPAGHGRSAGHCRRAGGQGRPGRSRHQRPALRHERGSLGRRRQQEGPATCTATARRCSPAACPRTLFADQAQLVQSAPLNGGIGWYVSVRTRGRRT